MALIRRKWYLFGSKVYFLALFFYALFVASISVYVLGTPAVYSASQILQYTADGEGAGIDRAVVDNVIRESLREGTDLCPEMRMIAPTLERSTLGSVARIILILLIVVHIIKELFQFILVGTNLLEKSFSNLTMLYTNSLGSLLLHESLELARVDGSNLGGAVRHRRLRLPLRDGSQVALAVAGGGAGSYHCMAKPGAQHKVNGPCTSSTGLNRLIHYVYSILPQKVSLLGPLRTS